MTPQQAAIITSNFRGTRNKGSGQEQRRLFLDDLERLYGKDFADEVRKLTIEKMKDRPFKDYANMTQPIVKVSDESIDRV